MTLIQRNTGVHNPGRFHASILAPPGKGKTVLCATLSECLPEGPVAFPLPNPIDLTDMQWVNIDGGSEHGGLDSLAQLGLHVDYFDLSATVGAELPNQLIEAAVECRKLAESGKKKTFVVDSLSVADKIIIAGAYASMLKDGKMPDTLKNQLWDKVLMTHTRIAMAFRAIPGNVLFTFHEKYLGDFSEMKGGEVQEARRAAEGQITGTADLDLSGRIRSFYVATASYIITIGQNTMPGGKVERFITTQAQDTFTKARSQKLAAKEPFDLRLLVKKLEG